MLWRCVGRWFAESCESFASARSKSVKASSGSDCPPIHRAMVRVSSLNETFEPMQAITQSRSGGAPAPLLTRKQVAEMLGVHCETIKRWQRANRLPAIIINSRVIRYEPSVVRQMIEDAKVA